MPGRCRQSRGTVGILHDLKYDLARTYLRETSSSISSSAWLLGYEEVSSFTHAFKRWSGKTPKQARFSLQ
jgi:AraC-like DNA-binding protein